MKKKGNAVLKKLKKIRLAKNMNINEMAAKVGMSKSMYDYIEKGERRLSYRDAKKIAEALGMTPDELFFEDYKEFLSDVII